jgi:hypothetical protein
VNRKNWYPVPITADDFRDGNQGLSSKTIYYSFLVEKNPGVDKQKLESLMNKRVSKIGKDGQLLYIPDFMSEKAPSAKRFYEVKPGLPDHENLAGEEKIASVDGLMAETNLPYKPGTDWKASGFKYLFIGALPLGPLPIPLPVVVTFVFGPHDRIQGLVVYRFCIDLKFKIWIALHLIIAVIAVIVWNILFPETEIPDVPEIPELPEPSPIPNPFPPKPVPEPVPVPGPNPFESLRGTLASFQESPLAAGYRRHALTGSVGVGGRNAEADVKLVQFLLNSWQSIASQGSVAIDGIAGPITCGAITAVQRGLGLRVVDGRVDPGGPTLQVLGKLATMAIGCAVKSGQSGGSPVGYYANEPRPDLDPLSVFWAALSNSGNPRYGMR